jgi:hypothetical protein
MPCPARLTYGPEDVDGLTEPLRTISLGPVRVIAVDGDGEPILLNRSARLAFDGWIESNRDS